MTYENVNVAITNGVITINVKTPDGGEKTTQIDQRDGSVIKTDNSPGKSGG